MLLRTALPAALALGLLAVAPADAAEQKTIELTIKDHKFTPDRI